MGSNKQRENMTLGDLPFGTSVLYNDCKNYDVRFVVIGQVKDDWGLRVEMLKENGCFESFCAHYDIGRNWSIAKDEI